MVRVPPHLRWQVEGHGESRLAVVYEVLKAGVRLARRSEPRVLAHGPWPATIHARVGTTGVRVRPWVTKPFGVVEVFEILWLVEGLDLDPGLRTALVLAFLGVHGSFYTLESGV